ncbi:hypothetical protein PLESTB_000696500 [Pleodorina starrii]|uniref:Formate/nitrite transporter n=1 Tax=Pleodorina starrii TaxID=330485 RepID=A0A9W6F1A8_9CHLO|nr:hypothetical protein PLESTM_001220400 [Pleodorina starrii]GLC52993.1 hypothetical protein PLESTB_000696500 [Pleodorina starrii]GLC65290.1 hypothetical protein PLESTF_000272900 [Pleodorina starrii]
MTTGNGHAMSNGTNGGVDGNVSAHAGIKVELVMPEGEVQDIQNARIYHDEHFSHGVRVTADETTGPSRKATGILGMRSPTNLDPNAGLKAIGAVSLGTPMPKWPPGHQSAAFEAVAVKKSFILSPAEIYAECAHHGEEKSKFAWYKLWTLSIIAGCYVGFGYTTCLLIGGTLLQAPGVGKEAEENYGLFKLVYGAVGFPFSFTTIVVCGSELYTSLCAYMTAAWWEGKVGVLDVLRMLAISWIGNFIGCAGMAGLFRASGVYDHHDTTLKRQVAAKLALGWGAVFVKGIFANWLVGIATWMANAAQDLTGKAVAIWLPISAFGMIGFEHCIANMFLFVMAWCQGENITAKQFIWHNLIPSTLGNYIGGGVCLSTVYAIAYGAPPKRIGKWLDQKLKRN